MDKGNSAGAVQMGMGIDIIGNAMGCPTGMANTDLSFQTQSRLGIFGYSPLVLIQFKGLSDGCYTE